MNVILNLICIVWIEHQIPRKKSKRFISKRDVLMKSSMEGSDLTIKDPQFHSQWHLVNNRMQFHIK